MLMSSFLRMITKDTLKLLKVKKKDKLAFVFETAYNTEPVTMTRKGNQKGCISGSYQNMVNVDVSVSGPQRVRNAERTSEDLLTEAKGGF